MSYARKVVLHCPNGYSPDVDRLVGRFMSDGVVFVGVVGPDCARIEDLIDELVVGDGTRQPYSMLTSSHSNESLAEALEFADSLIGEFAGETQVVQA